jgi:hypothetical protein
LEISSNNNLFRNLYTKPLDKDEVKELKQAIVDNANRYTFKSFTQEQPLYQNLSSSEKIMKNTEDFQKFLYENGIDGKSVRRISELTFDTPSFLNIKA